MPLSTLKNFNFQTFKRQGEACGYLSLSKNEPTVTKHSNPISQISRLTYKHGLTRAIWSYQQSINNDHATFIVQGLSFPYIHLGRRYYKELPWIQVVFEGFRMSRNHCTRLVAQNSLDLQLNCTFFEDFHKGNKTILARPTVDGPHLLPVSVRLYHQQHWCKGKLGLKKTD